MKLLVVEDEIKTGDSLKQGLMEAGFNVDLARDGLDGQHLALTEPYDLIVLNVMLPDVDGWRIVQSLRETNTNTPVLFLTARDSVNARVKGLELGADGYLVKPFAFFGIPGKGSNVASPQCTLANYGEATYCPTGVG